MKHFISVIMLVGIMMISLGSVSHGAKSCAYCGQYFFLGDTNPMSECMRLKSECMQVHKNSDKANSCMCSIDRSVYMQKLVQLAKERTAHMFANMAMPFLPGVHLIDPDLRKEFFDPNTPLHRKMEISLGHSTDLIGGVLGTALGAMSAVSEMNDPNVTDKDKLVSLIGEALPHFEGGGTISSVMDVGQGIVDLYNR